MDYDDIDFEHKFKIVLTGEMGVGKTRIVQRYVKKMYDSNKETSATIGKPISSSLAPHQF